MKRIKGTLFWAVLLGQLAVAAFGQEWYVGAIGGFGFAPALTVTGSAGTASTGFNNGYAAGAFLGEDRNDSWGGEVRYLYRQSDLKLESGGTSTQFGANTNILNFDVLWHARSREYAVRPFIAVGAGMKFLDGTGTESPTQPLGTYAALTHTRESLPVGDVGVGVKVKLHRSWQFRAEVQDYMGPAPSKVIAAAPGATIGGFLNDIIASASIAYCW